MVLNLQYPIPRNQCLPVSTQSPEDIGETQRYPVQCLVYTYTAYRVIITKGCEAHPIKSEVTEPMPRKVQEDVPMWHGQLVCGKAVSPGVTWQKNHWKHFLMRNLALNFDYTPGVSLRIYGEVSNNYSLFLLWDHLLPPSRGSSIR